MISDVLFTAARHIDRYLSDSAFSGAYEGELRARIVTLVAEIESLRVELDTPPTENHEPEPGHLT